MGKEELKGLDSHQLLMSTMNNDIENHIDNLRYDMTERVEQIKDDYLNKNRSVNQHISNSKSDTYNNIIKSNKQSVSDKDFK